MKNSNIFLTMTVIVTAFLSVSCSGGETISLPELTMAPVNTTAEKSAEELYGTDPYAQFAIVETSPVTKVTKAEDTYFKGSKFQLGIWYSYGNDSSSYFYWFGEDGNGSRISTEDGVTAPFTFDLDEDKETIVFTSDFSTNVTEVPITGTIPATSDTNKTKSKNTIIKLSANPAEAQLYSYEISKEKMIHHSLQSFNEFIFYTDQELLAMALSYYKINTPEAIKGVKSSLVSNEDGTVSIRIYRELPEKTIDYDLYTVNRIDTKGKDKAGNAISLVG